MDENYILQLINSLDLGGVTTLAEAAARRQAELEQEQHREAEERFINAYKEFRNVAPCKANWVSYECETSRGGWEEIDLDLYELLDNALHIR